MSNTKVSSLSSSIANLLTNTPAKKDSKRKNNFEKADYKKRHITYNEKRNEKSKGKTKLLVANNENVEKHSLEDRDKGM